jgi:hypothetical protein
VSGINRSAYNSSTFPPILKKFLKDPGPLKNKKRICAAQQLFKGRYWIVGRPGLKTE